MKTQTFLFTILIFVIVAGLILPNGVRAAVANNIWSVRFVRQAYAEDGVDPAGFSPPATHKHAGLLLANQALKRGDVEGAWASIAPLDSREDALVVDLYAQVLYLRGDYQQALDIWKAAGNARSIHNAGIRLLNEQGRTDLRLIAVRYAYEIYPEEYVHGYAYALYESGNPEAAIALLNQMLAYYPGSLRRQIWYRYLGDLYQRQEKYTEAVDIYRQALQEDPNNAAFWQNLGWLYAQQYHDLPQAINCYQIAIELKPDEPQLHFQMAILYYEDAQLVRAEQSIQTALLLKPDDIRYHLYAAQIYEKSEDLDRAWGAYQSALAIDPNNQEAQQGLERLTGSH